MNRVRYFLCFVLIAAVCHKAAAQKCEPIDLAVQIIDNASITRLTISDLGKLPRASVREQRSRCEGSHV